MKRETVEALGNALCALGREHPLSSAVHPLSIRENAGRDGWDVRLYAANQQECQELCELVESVMPEAVGSAYLDAPFVLRGQDFDSGWQARGRSYAIGGQCAVVVLYHDDDWVRYHDEQRAVS